MGLYDISCDLISHRYTWVVFGCLFFQISNHLLLIILPGHIKSTSQAWKWRNTANSLVHSVITGLGSLYGFHQQPAMAEDLLTTHTAMALRLVALSLGYFMFDFYDMARHHRKRSTFELLGHHLCVISCFGLAVATQLYIGYAMVALLVEVNSIFLHLRQLQVVEGRGRSGGLYRAIALCNVATFLVFRIAVLGWMVRWLALNTAVVPPAVVALGAVALAVIMVMNIVLFHRLCSVDFGRQRGKLGEKERDVSIGEKGQGLVKDVGQTLANGVGVNNKTLVSSGLYSAASSVSKKTQ